MFTACPTVTATVLVFNIFSEARILCSQPVQPLQQLFLFSICFPRQGSCVHSLSNRYSNCSCFQYVFRGKDPVFTACPTVTATVLVFNMFSEARILCSQPVQPLQQLFLFSICFPRQGSCVHSLSNRYSNCSCFQYVFRGKDPVFTACPTVTATVLVFNMFSEARVLCSQPVQPLQQLFLFSICFPRQGSCNHSLSNRYSNCSCFQYVFRGKDPVFTACPTVTATVLVFNMFSEARVLCSQPVQPLQQLFLFSICFPRQGSCVHSLSNRYSNCSCFQYVFRGKDPVFTACPTVTATVLVFNMFSEARILCSQPVLTIMYGYTTLVLGIWFFIHIFAS